MSRTVLAGIGLVLTLALALVGCADRPPPEEPAFYLSMAHGGARLDSAVAASMISGYRRNNGLDAVTVDPQLTAAAEAQSMAMARQNKLDHNAGGALIRRVKAAGFEPALAVENISAGYHTLAEAFSGWRDSPPHRDNMLRKGVTRMGIAATYAPNTKYKVFWTLILAAPDMR